MFVLQKHLTFLRLLLFMINGQKQEINYKYYVNREFMI